MNVKSWCLIALCIGFTGWWMFRIDYGVTIYRHSASESINNTMSGTFVQYFRHRNITSLRFGSLNTELGRMIPAEASTADEDRKWKTENRVYGPVLIKVDSDDEAVSVYWRETGETEEERARYLVDATWALLENYDKLVYDELVSLQDNETEDQAAF